MSFSDPFLYLFMKTLHLSVAFFAVCLFTIHGLSQAAPGDEAALHGLIGRLAGAQLAYDEKTLNDIFTSDYIEISPAGELDPREEVIGFYGPEAKAKAKASKIEANVEISEPSLRVYGNLAVVIVRLDFQMKNEGKALPVRGIRATYVARKVNGEWKLASAQYTGIRPPAAPK